MKVHDLIGLEKISSVKFKSLPLTTIEYTGSKDVNFLGKRALQRIWNYESGRFRGNPYGRVVS